MISALIANVLVKTTRSQSTSALRELSGAVRVPRGAGWYTVATFAPIEVVLLTSAVSVSTEKWILD
jgi:hypothetical protein